MHEIPMRTNVEIEEVPLDTSWGRPEDELVGSNAT